MSYHGRRFAVDDDTGAALPPEFKQRLWSKMMERQQQLPTRCRRRLRVAPLKMAGLAAAACLIAAVTWMLTGPGTSPAFASFAEMITRINSIETVSYDFSITVDGEIARSNVLLSSPGRARITDTEGNVTIVDQSRSSMLLLNARTKRARLVEGPVGGFAREIARLREVAPETARLSGREVIDGVEVAIYSVDEGPDHLRVWVEAVTKLPVRIECRHDGAADSTPSISVLENMKWNVPIDAATFSVEVPQGYTLFDPAALANEQALVELLRTAAKLNSGSFPKELSNMALAEMLANVEVAASRHPRTGTSDYVMRIDHADADAIGDCLSGLAFIEKHRASWRYVGQAVKVGDATRPVCWWQADEPGKLRAVYGDYSIRTVAAAELSR